MLLFDLDGTITDSNGIWTEVDARFLGQRGLEVTQEYLYTIAPSIVPLAARLTRDYYHLDMTPEAIIEEWREAALEGYRQVDLKPGVLDFLTQCRERGETMALVTACDPVLCQAALEHHDLVPFFQDLVFAQDIGLEKRNPELFLRTAQQLGVSPTECVLYDDAPPNCIAAKSVGMTTVGVYDPFYSDLQDELKQNCDRYIRSFTELLA